MKTPIEILLDGVEWVENPDENDQDELFATHSGVLKIAGHALRCYRLNDGQTVIDADDMNGLFA